MMVDTARPADRDKSYKNMKCPETVTTGNNYDLATVRTGWYQIYLRIKRATILN